VVNTVVVRPFRGPGVCGARVAPGWAAECEVPFEEVVVEGRGGVVRGWAGGELGCFADCGSCQLESI
jgi:hypothetical protein